MFCEERGVVGLPKRRIADHIRDGVSGGSTAPAGAGRGRAEDDFVEVVIETTDEATEPSEPEADDFVEVVMVSIPHR